LHALRPRCRTSSTGAFGITAVIVASLALSACGSSNSNSTSTASAPAATSSAGATSPASGGAADKSPITVMTIGDFNSPAPLVNTDSYWQSTKAALDAANAKGGINGHPMKQIVCDGHGDPNKLAECGRQAVQQKVTAVVGLSGLNTPRVVASTEKAGIPVIGYIPSDPQVWSSPLTYCAVSGSGVLNNVGAVAKAAGVTKLGQVLPSGLPQTQPWHQQLDAATKAAGVQVGGFSDPPPTTTNFTAAVTKATSNGENGLFFFSLAAPDAALTQAHQVAPNPKLVAASFMFQAGAKFPASIDGTTVVGWVQPPTATTVPGIERYLAELKQYTPATRTSESGVVNWLAGDWFARVAQTIKGDVTSKSLIDALNNLTNFDMGGITPPYSSSEVGKHYGMRCVPNSSATQLTVKNGALVAVHPGEFLK
jgi:ABC-type branched-subunit amino acid transport system substrate-binding protein